MARVYVSGCCLGRGVVGEIDLRLTKVTVTKAT